MEAPEKETTPAEEQKPEDIKKEESTTPGEDQKLTESFNRIEALEKRLDDQSRIIGKYENLQKKEQKQPEPKKEEAKGGEFSQFSELEQKVAALEARDEARLESITKAKYAQAIVANGGDPKSANDAADFLAFKNKDATKSESDNLGEVSVTVGEDNTPVGDWVKMFMASDEGSFLNASKKGPSPKNKGDAQESGSMVELSSIDYSKKISEIQNDYTLTQEQRDSKIKAFKIK